jgi:hypothetical protein
MLEMSSTTGSSYNEVVVSTSIWVAHLPATIAAISFNSGEAKAREVHRAFLQHFGRTAAQTPLVRLDLRNLQAPFSLVEN